MGQASLELTGVKPGSRAVWSELCQSMKCRAQHSKLSAAKLHCMQQDAHSCEALQWPHILPQISACLHHQTEQQRKHERSLSTSCLQLLNKSSQSMICRTLQAAQVDEIKKIKQQYFESSQGSRSADLASRLHKH